MKPLRNACSTVGSNLWLDRNVASRCILATGWTLPRAAHGFAEISIYFI